MKHAIQICIAGALVFVCIVGWKSNSGITSTHLAHSAQAVDQPTQQGEKIDSAKTKNSDSELVRLNLGSLPKPPAPDPPETTNGAKPHQANKKTDGSNNIDHQSRN